MEFDFKNEKLKQMVEFLMLHPKEYTVDQLAERFGLTYDQVSSGIRRGKKKYSLDVKPGRSEKRSVKDRKEYIPPPPNTETILVIGDIHEPYTLEPYRDFCYHIYKKYKCTHVIYTGDLIDAHAMSYHEHDPDGMSAGDELDEALENIAKWYKLFPKADVLLGNHDRLAMRKAFTGGIPRRWMTAIQDVLNVPTWNFKERFVYDNVQYIHGEGGTARVRCKKDLMSTVQGHLHTQSYTEHFVGQNYHIFGSQVGCGVDRKSYAMAYAKEHPKPSIAVMVIANHGTLPINILMPL